MIFLFLFELTSLIARAATYVASLNTCDVKLNMNER